MEQRWHLGNKKTNKVEKNLYPNQIAQRVIDSFREGFIEQDWVVWVAGWPTWKPLTEIHELIHEISIIKKLAEEAPPPPMPSNFSPPPPPMNLEKPGSLVKPLVSMKAHELPIPPSRPQVATDETEPPDTTSQKRKHKRIFVRLRCIIRSSTLTFRTFTKDISLGGVALEHEIPIDLVGTECTIYITSPKVNKNLRFKVALTGRSVPKYFSFQQVDDIVIAELSQWLDEHSQISAA
jgi:hypothetical protein